MGDDRTSVITHLIVTGIRPSPFAHRLSSHPRLTFLVE